MRVAITILVVAVGVGWGFRFIPIEPTEAYPSIHLYLPIVVKHSMGAETPPIVPTPTVTPLSTPTATPTLTPTVTPVSCNGYAQALQNTGFQSGLDYWSTLSGSPSIYTLFTEHQLLLGNQNNTNDAVAQLVLVPSWAETAALYFTYYMDTFEGQGDPAADYFYADLLDDSSHIFSTYFLSNASGQYRKFVMIRQPIPNITTYRGAVIGVGLSATNNSSYPTKWYIDDVGLYFACGNYIAGVD